LGGQGPRQPFGAREYSRYGGMLPPLFFGENHEPNVGYFIPQETVRAALLLIKSQPLKKAMQKVQTKNRTEDEVEGYKFEMEEYLHYLFNLPFYFSRYRMHFMSCRCLHTQRENCLFPAVAARLGTFPFCLYSFFSSFNEHTFFGFFADYPRNVHETILKERIVAAKDHGEDLKKVRHLLTNQRQRVQQNQMFRYKLGDDHDEESAICIQAFRNLFG
jgi:hypothetical protein